MKGVLFLSFFMACVVLGQEVDFPDSLGAHEGQPIPLSIVIFPEAVCDYLSNPAAPGDELLFVSQHHDDDELKSHEQRVMEYAHTSLPVREDSEYFVRDIEHIMEATDHPRPGTCGVPIPHPTNLAPHEYGTFTYLLFDTVRQGGYVTIAQDRYEYLINHFANGDVIPSLSPYKLREVSEYQHTTTSTETVYQQFPPIVWYTVSVDYS